MRNYLILKEKAQAFRADPQVAEALEAARVGELAVPTLGAGESLDALRAEVVDPVALGERGLHFERLDQLAMEHLLGVR
jgi:xylose isomerase